MLSYVTNYAEVRLPNLKSEQNRARKHRLKLKNQAGPWFLEAHARCLSRQTKQ